MHPDRLAVYELRFHAVSRDGDPEIRKRGDFIADLDGLIGIGIDILSGTCGGRKIKLFQMERIILHSDCNCFYASVEILHHPELAGKLLAVGGDPEARHGIVLTANYIAKRKGVKDRHGTLAGQAGMPGSGFCPAEDGSVPPVFQDGPRNIP